MATVADILTELARMAPFDKAAPWDPVGLQLGDPAAEVGDAVAVAHELTETAVDDVLHRGDRLVVAYHPLLFRPLGRLVAGAHPGGRALRLAAGGVAVATLHTNLDAAPGGTADALAKAFDLHEVRPFGPLDADPSASPARKVVTFVPADAVDRVQQAMADAGGGTIGNYTHCAFRVEGIGTFHAGEGTAPAVGEAGATNAEPEVRVEMVVPAGRLAAVLAALVAAHPYEEPAFDVYPVAANSGFVGRVGTAPAETTLGAFAEVVAHVLGTAVRAAGSPATTVKTVAVVPGSGASTIRDAVAAGADVLVTGDVSHHRAREALDAGLTIVDPGHAPTERPGIEAFYAAVRRIVPSARLVEVDPHPWEVTS